MDLKFEYSQRRNQLLTRLLKASDEREQQAIIHSIEEGDRELEDYLANLDTGSSAGIGATTYSSQWGDSVADITGSWQDFSSITFTLDEETTFMVWGLAVGNTDGAVVAGTRITMSVEETFHIGPYATAAPQGTNKFYYELYTHGVATFPAGTHTVKIKVREEDGGTDFYITRTELQMMTTTLG